MILLLNESVLLLLKIQIVYIFLLVLKKKVTLEDSKDYEFCIKVALNHAEKRINIVKNSDKKCLLEEYKEWINDGLNKHTVLLLREDPII